MADEKYPAEQIEAGRRLAQLRTALGMSQDEMAFALGIEKGRLSGWEVGRNRPDALILGAGAQKLGFTVDWVARGALAGMDADLRDRLLEVLRTWTASERPRRGRPPRQPQPPHQPPLPAMPARKPARGLHEDDDNPLPRSKST